MKSTFVECKECKKHWFNGTGIEMCDNDWNCLEHEELHRTKDVCTITWHPYPEEKPSDEGKEYIVTVKSEIIGLFTICSEWNGKEGGWAGVFDDMVKAWAEMPKPYGEGA